MCEVAPGPRCAHHTGIERDKAQAVLDIATKSLNAAHAEWEKTKPSWRGAPESPEHQANTRAWQEASQAWRTAKNAHEQAQAAYDATPTGQTELQAEIAQMSADGKPQSEIDRATWRLKQSQDTRDRQKRDQAGAEMLRARLAQRTPEEDEAIQAADQAVHQFDREIDALEAVVSSLEAERDAAKAAVPEGHWHTFEQAVTKTETPVRNAMGNVQTQAVRLYTDAGMDEKTARMFAGVSVGAATAGDHDSKYRSLAEGPVRLHVSDSHADQAKMAAAAAAAETDKVFRQANAVLVERVTARAAARQAREDWREAAQKHDRLAKQAAEAKTDLDRVQNKRTAARDASNRLRAQIGVGAGLTAQPINLDRPGAREAIMRQPDGTTNAYVYQAPSKGLPHGRYVPVTGVKPIYGNNGAANALVTEHGDEVHATERYYRNLNGLQHHEHSPQGVIAVPPAPGSTPLVNEANPGRGYAVVHDSTD